MRVLLVHPEDDLPRTEGKVWDLAVDLGRAPRSLYERWKQSANCEALSLYDFAEEIEDLYRIRKLLQLGSGQLVDSEGIDWWNVIGLELVPDLLRLMLARRLAERLVGQCEVLTSRPDLVASALSFMLGLPLRVVGGLAPTWRRRIAHYSQLLTRLDRHQLVQVLEDKLHLNGFGRKFSTDGRRSCEPVILLPSAYSNASRAAAGLAAQLPDCKFLLVYTRTSGKVSPLPLNVASVPLAMGSTGRNADFVAQLLDRWQELKNRILSQAEEYKIASAVGALDKISPLLRWGLSYRDAWARVFSENNVTGCLCTDDSNPPTRIPLDLARARGLPAVACHHGALDYFMVIKTTPAEFYIAKSEMERDYLRRVCRLPGEKIVIGKAGTTQTLPCVRRNESFDRRWLVFFSEPYGVSYWRSDEVYAELLPELSRLADNIGLQLILKIHPFESVKEHRRRLRRYLPQRASAVQVITGAPSPELWRNTRLALTVQSTTAVQCAELGIPVFLCGWLRDAHSGYQRQFARFGVGQVLQSVEEIGEIAMRLQKQANSTSHRPPIWSRLEREELQELFSGDRRMPLVSSA